MYSTTQYCLSYANNTHRDAAPDRGKNEQRCRNAASIVTEKALTGFHEKPEQLRGTVPSFPVSIFVTSPGGQTKRRTAEFGAATELLRHQKTYHLRVFQPGLSSEQWRAPTELDATFTARLSWRAAPSAHVLKRAKSRSRSFGS